MQRCRHPGNRSEPSMWCRAWDKTKKKDSFLTIEDSPEDISKEYQNYRKMKPNGTCGPSCSCYYCHLLNYPTSSEGEEFLMDDVAAVYGSGPATSGKTRHHHRSHHRMSQYRRPKRGRRPQRYFSPINNLSHCGGYEEIIPVDCLSRDVSESSETESDSDVETSQPILQGVPTHVRDFERLLYETRTTVFSDMIFDSIVDGAQALALGAFKFLTVCRLSIAHAMSRRTRLVRPQPDCADDNDNACGRNSGRSFNKGDGAELISVEVIKNMGCPLFIKDWSREHCD